MLIETTRYELPPEGISLLGYIVRRMHKTEWLTEVPALPAGVDAQSTAAYVQDVLAGRQPVPTAVALQVEHILRLARHNIPMETTA